ncbi:hypothetical protein FB567DRAFT_588744 [Paraphoma chrysanthemicola]|uniref:C2H2-type domain-containing protein n=1 Tax=Paraphoma chrysanthemicola TaxID=798071 RepID=A0A8K0RFY0_9PLEO|nr:hypothetical protein FB567DRAFT_588744 [Paraphoma chrysanthemicola]
MNVDSTITPAYTGARTERELGAVSHYAEHPEVTFQHQQQEQSTLEINSARSQTTSLSSGRLADLQAIEDAADTRFIVQWQEKTVDTSHASGSSTVATECDEESRRKLYRNYVLLRDWGMSYSVSQGQLDHLPSEAEDLIETICYFLNELVEILVHRIPGLRDGEPKLQEAAPDPMGSLHHQLNQREPIESQSTELFQETWSQCTDEICSYVELLGELHPAIESWVPVHELGPSPEPGQQSIDGAFSYSNLVRTKFQHAPMALTISLGELNYERYLRLLKAREANSGPGHEFQGITSDRAKSDSFHDTGLGTSIPYASTAPPSVAQTLAGESRARFPSLPRAADAGPFTCDFCGDTVFFGTTGDYRKHLLQDLQPYSCLETACARERRVFSSRKSWIEHLKADHDLQPKSPPRQCQLCMEMTGEGMLEICKHYSNHLEDIALASAQAFMTSDNDLASNSDQSIGDEAVEMEEEDENWSAPSPNEDSYLPMVPENSADLIEAQIVPSAMLLLILSAHARVKGYKLR